MALTFPAPMLNIDRFYSGLYSNRNLLIPPIKAFGRRIIELFDALAAGNNMEMSNRLTLKRRAGYVLYSPAAITGVVQKFYTFQPINQVFPIIDSTTGVFQVPPGGAPVTLISKTQGKQSSFKYIGNYLYVGNQEFSQKVDQSLAVTNWGISLSGASAGSAFVGTGTSFGAAPVWVNPANFQGVPDAAVATCTATNNNISAQLQGKNFGFAVSGTVIGIQVNLSGFQSTSAANTSAAVLLLKGGFVVGVGKPVSLGTSPGVFPLGGSADLWGTSWTISDINSASFGVAVVVQGNGGGTCVYSMDAAQVLIFTSNAPVIAVNAAAGTFSATAGYNYVYAYGSSNDGSMSNPTLPSISTGVFTNKLNVQITLIASSDPQVNQIRVFRTTDGGGSVFFELPNSPFPNAGGTVNDAALDSALIVSNQVIAPSVIWNPPPAGLQLMDWFAGRLWGAVGNLLYFAAGPDLLPNVGNGNTAWPPANVFALPTTIVKLIAMPFGLLVFTLDDVHIVQGIQNPGFTVNRFIAGVGARQQNAIDTDGSNIYVFTSDRQFLTVTANGLDNEVGMHIGDKLDNLDPTTVYVAVHRAGSQDNHCFVSDGASIIYPLNVTQSGWEAVQTPVGGCKAIGSIETSPGIHKFLLGSPSATQLVLQRDLTTFTDAGSAYPCNAQFGSIPVADPGQLAIVRSIVLKMTAGGNIPQMFFLANEITGAGKQLNVSTAPLDVPTEYAGTPYASKTYLAKEYLTETADISEGLMHLQFNIVYPANATPDELLGWAVYGPQPPYEQQTAKLPELQGR